MVKKRSYWIAVDIFFLTFFLGLDMLGRLFEDYLVNAFGSHGSRMFVVWCALALSFVIKKLLQYLIRKLLRGECKMFKFLKKLFRREFRKYKKLLKDALVRKAVEELLERLLAEKKARIALGLYIEQAKERLAERHQLECEALARQIACEQPKPQE